MKEEFIELFNELETKAPFKNISNLGVVVSNILIAQEIRTQNELIVKRDSETSKAISAGLDLVKPIINNMFKNDPQQHPENKLN